MEKKYYIHKIVFEAILKWETERSLERLRNKFLDRLKERLEGKEEDKDV